MNTFPISIEQGRSNILISECTHIDMDDVLWSTSIAHKVRRYEEHNESALDGGKRYAGFKALVMGALKQLAGYPEGLKLLQSLEDALAKGSNQVLIRPVDSGCHNAISANVNPGGIIYAVNVSRKEKGYFLKEGINPRGGSTLIELDPNFFRKMKLTISLGKEVETPEGIILGHELIHALHIAAGVQLPKEVGTESLFPIAEEESTIGGVSGTRNGYPLDKLKDFVTENKLRDSAGFPRRFNYQVFFNKDSSGLTVTSVTADALFDARVRRHVQLEKKRKTSVIPDLQLLLMALKNWKGPNLPEKFKTEFLKLGEWEQLRVLEIAQDGLAIGRSLLQQAFQQVKVGSPAEDFLSDSFV
ncbi:type III secretion system effector protein [Archangium lipolyticum]|uniref:type III secretion system effector protein n=1 Tax=Archangium lipolyticum TaxID=2970465 RepID=UPI00214A88DB|nr:type III secretion system effector protein [Archangium lipolyticum]